MADKLRPFVYRLDTFGNCGHYSNRFKKTLKRARWHRINLQFFFEYLPTLFSVSFRSANFLACPRQVQFENIRIDRGRRKSVSNGASAPWLESVALSKSSHEVAEIVFHRDIVNVPGTDHHRERWLPTRKSGISVWREVRGRRNYHRRLWTGFRDCLVDCCWLNRIR